VMQNKCVHNISQIFLVVTSSTRNIHPTYKGKAFWPQVSCPFSSSAQNPASFSNS
jgi:hypothetical protein